MSFSISKQITGTQANIDGQISARGYSTTIAPFTKFSAPFVATSPSLAGGIIDGTFFQAPTSVPSWASWDAQAGALTIKEAGYYNLHLVCVIQADTAPVVGNLTTISVINTLDAGLNQLIIQTAVAWAAAPGILCSSASSSYIYFDSNYRLLLNPQTQLPGNPTIINKEIAGTLRPSYWDVTQVFSKA